MIDALSLNLTVWRTALARFVRDLPSAAVLCFPVIFATVMLTDVSGDFGPEGDNPWLLWFASLFVFIVLWLPAFTGLLRSGLGEKESGWIQNYIGRDARRAEGHLTTVLALTSVLAFTVVGVAFLLLVSFIAALAVASRAAANAPELAEEAAEQAPEIGAYFGTGEWTAVIIAGAAFALFSIWFLTRLALAYPETIRLKRVQAMAALSLSRGHLFAITISGIVLAGLLTAIVWALRLVPAGAGWSGLVIELAVSWAGVTLVTGLLAAFMTALDEDLLARQADPAGT